MTPIVILLVDDEAPFVEAMERRLVKREYKVLTAYGGKEALDVLASKEGSGVDVVILDVKMPGMNGLETLVAIRRRQPLVEVIMLTGHATVESAIEGMKLGAYDYLMKPCEIEVLNQKITDASRKKREHETRILQAKAEMIAMRRGD
ncbi:MAG: response regulator [Pseudomonadota bacterium]